MVGKIQSFLLESSFILFQSLVFLSNRKFGCLKLRPFCWSLWEKKNVPITFKSMCSVPQSGLTLCNPMDYSLPGSSVHGIFQARILEWAAICFSREFNLLDKYNWGEVQRIKWKLLGTRWLLLKYIFRTW